MSDLRTKLIEPLIEAMKEIGDKWDVYPGLYAELADAAIEVFEAEQGDDIKEWLKLKNELLKSIISDKGNRITELESQLNEKDAEIALLKSDHRKDTTRLQNTVDELEKENESLHHQIQSYQISDPYTQGEYAMECAMNKRFEELVTENADLRQQLDEVRKEQISFREADVKFVHDNAGENYAGSWKSYCEFPNGKIISKNGTITISLPQPPKT